ncbi:MAG: hypothetical protein MUO26_07040 [Methanotrichaceae archaeon]|nr:hypothetical protein [Methanotrichaceae archaeon]
MHEDLSTLFGNGFNIWKNNLNLCFPFLLGIFFSIIALLPILAVLSALLSSDLESFSPETFYLEIKEDLSWWILGSLLLILLLSLINSFFKAAAIGMSRQALETGRSTVETMWSSGKNNLANMFFLSILTGLIMMIGIVFLLPGIAYLPWSQPFAIAGNPRALGLLLVGLIFLIFYLILISLILAIAPYILVIDRLGPMDAIKASLNFFRYNKFDVIVIWLIVLALSIGLQMIGNSLTAATNVATLQLLSILTGLINILVLAPLSTIWWTRLFMSRTNRLQEEDKSW